MTKCGEVTRFKPKCVSLHLPSFKSLHSQCTPAASNDTAFFASTALPGQSRTQILHPSQMCPIRIGSGSSSASVNSAPRRWRGPNSGVSSTLLHPISPRPAKTAAIRRLMLMFLGYFPPGGTGPRGPASLSVAAGGAGTASYP